MSFPIARKEGATPYAVPDVWRRDSQSREGTASPIQGLGNSVQCVQILSCNGSSDLTQRDVGHQKTIKEKREGRRKKRRNGRRKKDKHLKKMIGHIV